jgi:xanthosine utilization system XapX-like protein
MAFDRSRTLRGALAGSAAAAVWYAQMPLDKRLFGCDFDDTELLGALTGGGPAVGALLHLQNGALFGALYANVAPRVPVRPVLRGALVGFVEHLATWPAMALASPELVRSGRAFLQSAWRHALFGFVLGELERRMNGPVELQPVSDEAVASNGHGSAAHLVATR